MLNISFQRKNFEKIKKYFFGFEPANEISIHDE